MWGVFQTLWERLFIVYLFALLSWLLRSVIASFCLLNIDPSSSRLSVWGCFLHFESIYSVLALRIVFSSSRFDLGKIDGQICCSACCCWCLLLDFFAGLQLLLFCSSFLSFLVSLLLPDSSHLFLSLLSRVSVYGLALFVSASFSSPLLFHTHPFLFLSLLHSLLSLSLSVSLCLCLSLSLSTKTFLSILLLWTPFLLPTPTASLLCCLFDLHDFLLLLRFHHRQHCRLLMSLLTQPPPESHPLTFLLFFHALFSCKFLLRASSSLLSRAFASLSSSRCRVNFYPHLHSFRRHQFQFFLSSLFLGSPPFLCSPLFLFFCSDFLSSLTSLLLLFLFSPSSPSPLTLWEGQKTSEARSRSTK